MAKIEIEFNHSVNSSLQVGDNVYYCPNQSHGGFNTVDNTNFSNTGIVLMGQCDRISNDSNSDGPTVKVRVDVTVPNPTIVTDNIGIGDFVMFSKNNQVNLSSLLGYYAEAKFINNSPHEAELFAVSTEFSESSK